MKALSAILLTSLSALAQSRPAPAVLADGCVTSTVACNSLSFGRLGAGDCTVSGGTFADNFVFSGTAGEYITATVRPLSESYSSPTILIAPPPGDASRPVVIGGGGRGATVSYGLSSSGQWRLQVGTEDLFASGDYAISLTCETDPAPQLPQQCVRQTLLCNQAAAAYLTNQSCRFTNEPNFLYAAFSFYAVPGDLTTIVFTSSAFAGRFGVIRSGEQTYLVSSSRLSATEQIAQFSAPEAGMYDIVVTSQEPLKVGAFAINMACSAGGCLDPLIIHQPLDVRVPFGSRATLQAAASGSSLSFAWFNVSDFPVQVGTGASIQTPPVTAPQTYYYRVQNQCGSDQSVPFTVTPTVTRKRSVRH